MSICCDLTVCIVQFISNENVLVGLVGVVKPSLRVQFLYSAQTIYHILAKSCENVMNIEVILLFKITAQYGA